jgi:hypothetical protein
MTAFRSSFLLLALLAPALPAQDADPAAVVKRAVEAAGGAAVLAKYPAAKVVAKGTLFHGAAPLPVTAEQVYYVPGRSRTLIRVEAAGQKLDVLHVMNGKDVRYVINGAVIPTSDAARKDLQHALLVQEMAQLAPLLADKKFNLKPDTKARDPDLAWLVVGVKGFPDTRLGFDKKTGHLTRIARRALDGSTGKEFDQEQVLSDFKAFQGLTRPTRVVMLKDGQKSQELAVESLTPLETVDPKEFATGP